MHRATPSSTAATSSHPHRSRRQRVTRDQLAKYLEILGPATAPLPPSPPPSRSSSPAPRSKRKQDPSSQAGPSKRPRRSSVSEAHRHEPSPSILPAAGPSTAHPRVDPSAEDGELREDAPAPRDATVLATVPVRRPRRGRPSNTYFDALYNKYHSAGRALKYSGTVRLLSTYPPKSQYYRPVKNPPPQPPSYHKYGNLISRLELVDALVNFAYGFWALDRARHTVNRNSWNSMDNFIQICKQNWKMEESTDDREKAFLGLIYMIEAFIHGAKLFFSAKPIDHQTNKMLDKFKELHEKEVQEERQKAAAADGPTSLATPPMLPSPESVTNSNSANSTPVNRPNDASTAVPPKQQPEIPPASDKPRPTEDAVPGHITLPVNWYFVRTRKSQSSGILVAASSMEQSQRFLTLPGLAKHFPRTFTRMMHSSLGAHDEHEPDIEDEEGELFWPGQLITGGGMGWVCLMGKAMIKEFGKDLGYQGLDGIIPKPSSAEDIVSMYGSAPGFCPDPCDWPIR